MTEDNSPENLRKFLESNDPAIRRMGISMAKGSGCLDKTLIGLYFWDPEEENQKAAGELIKEIGIDKFKEFPEWLEPFNHSKLEKPLGHGHQDPIRSHLTTSMELIISFTDGRSTDLLISILKGDYISDLDSDYSGYWRALYLDIYEMAAEELAKRKSTKAVPILINVLATSNNRKRDLAFYNLTISCIKALRRINDKKSIEPIKSLIAHESHNIRKNAAESLEILGWKPETKDEKIDYLVAKEAWPSLILKGKDAVEKLVPRLEDESVTICTEAGRTLGKIGDESVVEPLIKALGMDVGESSSRYNASHKHTRNCLNQEALNALIEIGEPAIPNLIKNIRNRKMKISEGSIEILGSIGDSRVLKPLVEMLELKKESKRKKVFEALENLSKNIEIPVNIKEKILTKVMSWLDETGSSRQLIVQLNLYEFFKKTELENENLVVSILDKKLGEKNMTSGKRETIISMLKEIGGERVVPILIQNLHKKEAFNTIETALRSKYDDSNDKEVPFFTEKIYALIRGGEEKLYEARYNGKNSDFWRSGKYKYYLSNPIGVAKRDLAFYNYNSNSKGTPPVESIFTEKDIIFSLSKEILIKKKKNTDKIILLEDVSVSQGGFPRSSSFEFESKSKSDRLYYVTVTHDELSGKAKDYSCNCPGFNYRQKCRHIEETKVKIKKETIKKNDYVYWIDTYDSANKPKDMPWYAHNSDNPPEKKYNNEIPKDLNALYELLPKGIFESNFEMIEVIDSEGIEPLYDLVPEGIFTNLDEFKKVFKEEIPETEMSAAKPKFSSTKNSKENQFSKEDELLEIVNNYGINERNGVWSEAALKFNYIDRDLTYSRKTDIKETNKDKIKARAILELRKLGSEKSVKILLTIIEKVKTAMLSQDNRRENRAVGKGSVAINKMRDKRIQTLINNLKNEYVTDMEGIIRVIAAVLGEIGNKNTVKPLTNLYLETIATASQWMWNDRNEYIGTAEKYLCSDHTQKHIRLAIKKIDPSKLEFIDKRMNDADRKLGHKIHSKDICITEDLPDKRWDFGEYTVEALPHTENAKANTYYLRCNCREYNSGFEEIKEHCRHTELVKKNINLICGCHGLDGYKNTYIDKSKSWHKAHSGIVNTRNIYYLFDSYRTLQNQSPALADDFEERVDIDNFSVSGSWN